MMTDDDYIYLEKHQATETDFGDGPSPRKQKYSTEWLQIKSSDHFLPARPPQRTL
jgi:hypothetical protein